jgi:hypothetical protein
MDKSQVHVKSNGRRHGEMLDVLLFVLLFAGSFQECDLRTNLELTTRERLGARVAANERLVRQLEQSSVWIFGRWSQIWPLGISTRVPSDVEAWGF